MSLVSQIIDCARSLNQEIEQLEPVWVRQSAANLGKELIQALLVFSVSTFSHWHLHAFYTQAFNRYIEYYRLVIEFVKSFGDHQGETRHRDLFDHHQQCAYGDERPYNALRLAMNLSRREDTQVKVFLTADGVACARKGQKTPDGYYNIERMIKSIASKGKVAT